MTQVKDQGRQGTQGGQVEGVTITKIDINIRDEIRTGGEKT